MKPKKDKRKKMSDPLGQEHNEMSDSSGQEHNEMSDPSVQERYEDHVSRLAMEGVIMKKAAGPHIASFLGLLRLNGELVLVTYLSFWAF